MGTKYSLFIEYCPHPLGTCVASLCRPPPFLPVFFSGQGRECSSRDLRTSGMSMAGATPIRSQLDIAGGACSGSSEAAGEAGAGWGAASCGGRRGGSLRQPIDSMDPSPPVHPQLGHLPAPAAARPSLPAAWQGGPGPVPAAARGATPPIL